MCGNCCPGQQVRASLMNAERTVGRPITWCTSHEVRGLFVGDRRRRGAGESRPGRWRTPPIRAWWSADNAAIGLWIPYLWLLIFFLAPFLIVLKISLSQVTARPAALRALVQCDCRDSRQGDGALVRQLRLFRLLSALLGSLSVERLDRLRLDRDLRSSSAIRSPTAWRGRRRAMRSRCW